TARLLCNISVLKVVAMSGQKLTGMRRATLGTGPVAQRPHLRSSASARPPSEGGSRMTDGSDATMTQLERAEQAMSDARAQMVRIGQLGQELVAFLEAAQAHLPAGAGDRPQLRLVPSPPSDRRSGGSSPRRGRARPRSA